MRVLIAALMVATPALGQMNHSDHNPAHWYDLRCCDRRDCRPLEDDEYSEVSGGYLIHATGEVIPYNLMRPSQDGRFHRCTIGHNPDGLTRRLATDGLYCFYAPLGF